MRTMCALFSSMASCETRCRAQMAAKVWVVAHSARNVLGVIVARFQRFMAPTSATTRAYGRWEETDQDNVN